MRRVNRWKPPRWIRLWMIPATRAGDGWLWYVLGMLVMIFGGPSRFAAVTAAGVSCGLGTVLFLALKKLTGRKRPCAVAPHCWATLLPPDQFSFPSGHSINAFAFAGGADRPRRVCDMLMPLEAEVESLHAPAAAFLWPQSS